MKTTLLRAGALSCALLASTALTTPAAAQLVAPAPVRQSIDANGVDLFLGTMNLNAPALTMGQADQGLAYYRLTRGGGWTDNIVATLNQSGSVVTVSLGGISDSFTVSGGTYTGTEGNGASLALNTGTHIYTYMRNDGTVIRFDQVRSGSYPFYANQGRAIDITRPSGAKLTFTYDSIDYCGAAHQVGNGYVCITPATAYRVGAVRNSYGYQLAFTYDEIVPYDPDQPEVLPDLGTWATVTSASATNLAIASGASTPSQSFGFSTVGGVTSFNVTDPMSRTTSYRFGAGGTIAGITLPGSGSEDVTIAYSSGRVSSVTSAAAGATAYASSDAAGVRTVTVTDALSHTTTYTFDIASQRMTSVTDANGHATSYQYDGSGRVTQVAAPDGNYVQYTYDSRGNVTETRAVAKPASGLDDMVTSATYPSSCANPVTCNQPTSTTDARGNVTDYTYDSTHGGVLTVTAPAPSGSGTRPETRYGYSSLQAYQQWRLDRRFGRTGLSADLDLGLRERRGAGMRRHVRGDGGDRQLRAADDRHGQQSAARLHHPGRRHRRPHRDQCDDL
jgi:YD repeat-containing protein